MGAHAAVPQMLLAVWERSLPLIRERLDQLDRAAASAVSGTLMPDDLQLAHSNAHKLAGSLGTFGYPKGSELARSIEIHLEAGPPFDAAHLLQSTTALRDLVDH